MKWALYYLCFILVLVFNSENEFIIANVTMWVWYIKNSGITRPFLMVHRAHYYYKVLAGSYVHLLIVVVCMKMHTNYS